MKTHCVIMLAPAVEPWLAAGSNLYSCRQFQPRSLIVLSLVTSRINER
jgi:hypothetical protein